MQKLLIFFILISCGHLIFSCQKKMGSIDCKITPAMNKSLLFNSSNINFDIADITFNQTKYENDTVIMGAKTIAAKDYFKVNDFVNELTGVPLNSISLLFYVEGSPNSVTMITKENVKGISLFSKVGKLYRHRFFLSENGDLNELQEFDLEVYGMFLQSELYMNKHLVNAGTTKSFTLFFSNAEAEFPKNHINVDLLKKKAMQYVSEKNSNSLKTDDEIIDPADGYSCDVCGVAANGTCKRVPGSTIGGPQVECEVRGGCGSSQVRSSLAGSGSYSTDSITLTFKDNLHYRFRDSLLNKTAFGRRYIRYYYDLSSIYSDKYSLGLMLSASRTLLKYNSLIESLVTVSNNENQQFLSNQLKSELLTLITSFKANYNDAYTEQLFYQIIQDINGIGTKTTSQVRQDYFGL